MTTPSADRSAETLAEVLVKALHAERTKSNSLNADCWACEAASSVTVARLAASGADAVVILDAIKSVREQATEERVAMDAQGEPLTDYSSGVLDGIDAVMTAAKKAAYRPDDHRKVTSIEEWWACEDAYQAGLAAARVEQARAGEGALREAAESLRDAYVSARWRDERVRSDRIQAVIAALADTAGDPS